MEVARSGVSVLGDGSIACVRPQKISRQSAAAGDSWVARLGGVLVLWQEGRAIGYRIQIDLLDQVTGSGAHVSGIEHQRIRQFGLNPKIERIHRRNLGGSQERGDAWRSDRGIIDVRERRDLTHEAIVDSRRKDRRRIGKLIEDDVSLRAIVKDAAATAYYQIGLAGDVIGEVEARGNLDATVLGEIFADPMASLEDSIGDVARPGHNTTDIKARKSISYCIAWADRCVTGARTAAGAGDSPWLVEPRSHG